MKRKYFKIVLPAFAFMLAITLSFTTKAQNEVEDAPISGYKAIPGNCISVSSDCVPGLEINCTVPGTSIKVFENKNGTSCSAQLSKPVN